MLIFQKENNILLHALKNKATESEARITIAYSAVRNG